MNINPDEIMKTLKEKQREQTRDIGEAYYDTLDACKYNALRKIFHDDIGVAPIYLKRAHLMWKK